MFLKCEFISHITTVISTDWSQDIVLIIQHANKTDLSRDLEFVQHEMQIACKNCVCVCHLTSKTGHISYD